MPSNDGAGAKGALALLALVALIVLAMQVMDQIAGEWRRGVFRRVAAASDVCRGGSAGLVPDEAAAAAGPHPEKRRCGRSKRWKQEIIFRVSGLCRGPR